MSVTEFSLSVDDFQNPKNYKNKEAIMMLLTRLALLEPGTIQSHPDMGLGLYSKFMYGFPSDADSIRSEFQSQIIKYLPQFQGVRVGVREKDKTFSIAVEIDDALYGIYYNIDTASIDTNFTLLNDL